MIIDQVILNKIEIVFVFICQYFENCKIRSDFDITLKTKLLIFQDNYRYLGKTGNKSNCIKIYRDENHKVFRWEDDFIYRIIYQN